jgi:hypothetical protein
MADNTVNTNQNKMVTINTSGESWLITKNVTITVTNQHGIYEGNTPNTIDVLGDITVSGATYNGINFMGATSSVSIGADSVIDATKAKAGIQYDGNGGHIDVFGTIKGGEEAIHGNISAIVTNHGSLTGDAGMIFDDAGSDITNFKSIDATTTGIASGAADTLIVNKAGAQILADDQGILLTGGLGDESVISNDGLIKAAVAIEDGSDNLTLTNTGKIVGDVILGDGDDFLDTRKGTIVGKIEGNSGDDTFMVSKSSTRIEEEMGGGNDTVFSTAKYHLDLNVDNLVLMGKKDLDGTGTKYDNHLTGNKGDNELVGLNGNDTIDGRKGNDTLEGDLGFDTFVFNTGGGKDHVSDFADGVDLIKSNMVKTMTDFDNLIIKQSGEDVVIDFGGGNTLTIDHFTKSDLTYGDFDV